MNLKLIRNTVGLALTALFVGIFPGVEALAADDSVASDKPGLSNTPILAHVGDRVVTVREYEAAVNDAKRKKFYHGQPNQVEIEAFRREIGEKLIARALQLIEAKRLKLKPDAKLVEQQLAKYEQENITNRVWQRIRHNGLPILKRDYEDASMRSQLEQIVRKVPAPSDKQLRAYYNANLDKFTEPEQVRVSVILISVDPSDPDFDAGRVKAEDVLKQLKAGADFAELAALHSGDILSADQGGDMGYLHGGMLPPLAEQVVSKLKPGELSEATGMMEGFAIFKLIDRQEAKTSSFDRVEERVKELYTLSESDRAWESLLARLRKEIPVQVDESHYVKYDIKW